jgi:hypothetical protein
MSFQRMRVRTVEVIVYAAMMAVIFSLCWALS